jgi:biopolymer transport protein ExbB
VDPARGSIIGLFLDRPSFMERIEKGEAVGYVIIFVGALGMLLALIQAAYLIVTRIKVNAQLKDLNRPQANNPLGRVLLAARSEKGASDSPEVVELRISEAVLREMPALERYQAFLRLAVAAGPLLGLIGTVVGMIITFRVIVASGTSDPKLMATGIGQAMIATVLGLGIAIPLLFINSWLSALSRKIINVLDEESQALLARNVQAAKQA